MISGGNATVFVTEMDRAVRFYTEVLQMELTSRFEDHWATVMAGGFTIGLHPRDDRYPAPGTSGSITVGLNVEGSIEAAAERLRSNNVGGVGEILRGSGGTFLHFCDPDGNALYFWEMPKG